MPSQDIKRNDTGRKEYKNTSLKLQVLGAMREVCGWREAGGTGRKEGTVGLGRSWVYISCGGKLPPKHPVRFTSEKNYPVWGAARGSQAEAERSPGPGRGLEGHQSFHITLALRPMTLGQKILILNELWLNNVGIPTCQNCGTEQTTHFVFRASLEKGENMTGSKKQRLCGILQSTISSSEHCLPDPLHTGRAHG